MSEAYLHGVEVLELDVGARPIKTVRSSVIGIVGTAPSADEDVFPLDTPVLITTEAEAADLDTIGTKLGTLPNAVRAIQVQAKTLIVVVRVAVGVDAAATLANVIGGVDGTTGNYEGVHAFRGARSICGVEPKVLCAPSFSGEVTRDGSEVITAAPVAAELKLVAGKLRAIAVVEGPNTTDADALTFAELFNNGRVYVADPAVKMKVGTTTETIGASAFAAGAIARSDNERGFWSSPSNIPLEGVVGLGRPIEFQLGNDASRANVLNEGNVTTIIREQGFRLWGNRVPNTDTKFQFLCVRRTADMIQESLLAAHLWAVDRGITKTYVSEVIEGVRKYLRDLQARGAILRGDCWADPDLNTPTAIAAGRVYFDFDFTPVYPAERVTFRSRLSAEGLEEVAS